MSYVKITYSPNSHREQIHNDFHTNLLQANMNDIKNLSEFRIKGIEEFKFSSEFKTEEEIFQLFESHNLKIIEKVEKVLQECESTQYTDASRISNWIEITRQLKMQNSSIIAELRKTIIEKLTIYQLYLSIKEINESLTKVQSSQVNQTSKETIEYFESTIAELNKKLEICRKENKEIAERNLKNLYDKEQEYKIQFEKIKANYYNQSIRVEEISRPVEKIKNIKEVILQTNIQTSQNENNIYNSKISEYENIISIYKEKLMKYKKINYELIQELEKIKGMAMIEEEHQHVSTSHNEVLGKRIELLTSRFEELFQAVNFKKTQQVTVASGLSITEIKDLTIKLLKNLHLKSVYINNLFKLGNIDLNIDDINKAKRNLLRVMSAVYFVKSNFKEFDYAFNIWKIKSLKKGILVTQENNLGLNLNQNLGIQDGTIMGTAENSMKKVLSPQEYSLSKKFDLSILNSLSHSELSAIMEKIQSFGILHQKEENPLFFQSYESLKNCLIHYIYSMFHSTIQFAEGKNQQVFPVFEEIFKEIKYLIGPLLFEITKTVILFKKGYHIKEINVEKYMQQNNHQFNIQNDEISKWSLEAIMYVSQKKPHSENEIPFFLFRLLTVLYKCTSVDGKLMIKDEIKEIIESAIFNGLNLYLKEFQNPLKSIYTGFPFNKHLFCKYPFMKHFSYSQNNQISG